MLDSIYLGDISDKNIINPIICHTERAGFANENKSTTTSFHNILPINPKITIANKKATKNEIKLTYALRFSLESEEETKPSTAALTTVDKPIYNVFLFFLGLQTMEVIADYSFSVFRQWR